MLTRPSLIAAFTMTLLSASFAAPEPARSPVQSLAVGGGFTAGGLTAEYFANPDLSGAPAWTRRDPRVKFDWGELLPITGVNTEKLRAFPRDGFSIRWTGQVVPRFSETYTFHLVSDEGARLSVRAQGTSDWTTVVDAWSPHARREDQGTFVFKSGQRYDLRLEYRDDSGPAAVELRWSSPSTPRELIEPLSFSQIHSKHILHDANDLDAGYWSERVRGGDTLWRPMITVDEQGWPAADLKTDYIQGTWPGTFLLQFKGAAKVAVEGGNIIRPGTEKAPASFVAEGYDPATNTTRHLINVGQAPKLRLTETRRTPDSPIGSGVTDLYFMKPIARGAKEPHEPGRAVADPVFPIARPYIVFRHQGTAFIGDITWEQRKPREYEYLVLAANELGMDFHLCFGASIDQDYMRRLARLVKYGSDGAEPYDRPVADPVYPPLNSNLRFYIEHGNEMGWSAIQPSNWSKIHLPKKRADNHPDWQIVNFDGEMKDAGFPAQLRYHALRTVQFSEICREVFGEEAMGDRVRPLLFGQYNQPWQVQMAAFIDAYFNNGDGKRHVEHPRPVNQLIWGTGGATYYGNSNTWGRLERDPVGLPEFAAPALQPGATVLRPDGLPWRFYGHAGVLDARSERTPLLTGVQPAAEQNTKSRWAGFRFRTGSEDLVVYSLGRTAVAGSNGDRRIFLFNAEGKSLHRYEVTASLKDVAPGSTAYGGVRVGAWMTADSHRAAPITLRANTTYHLAVEEPAGQTIAGASTPVQAAPGITIEASVFGETKGGKDLVVTFSDAQTGSFAAGAPNLLFAPARRVTAEGAIGNPPDDASPQSGYAKDKVEVPGTMAFIEGTGAFEQTVNIEKADDYGVSFWAATSGGNPLNIYLDDQLVWSKTIPSGSRKPASAFFQYSTDVIPLAAGPHRLRFEGTKPGATAFITRVAMVSMDAFYGGEDCKNFWGAGEATGTTNVGVGAVYRAMSDMARVYGTVPYSYEGNWSLGGDWNVGNVRHFDYTKYKHPLTIPAHQNVLRFWAAVGGWVFAHYYEVWPGGIDTAADASIQKAVVELADQLVESRAGIPVPAELGFDQPNFNLPDGTKTQYRGLDYAKGVPQVTSATIGNRGWKAWLILVPETADYEISVEAAAGGELRVFLNESDLLWSGPSDGKATAVRRLTRGTHAIKIRAGESSFDLKKVTVSKAR